MSACSYDLAYGEGGDGTARIALCRELSEAARAHADFCHAAVVHNAQTVDWHERMVAGMGKPGFAPVSKAQPDLATEVMNALLMAGFPEPEFLSMNNNIPEGTRGLAHVDEYDERYWRHYLALLTGEPTTRLLGRLPDYSRVIGGFYDLGGGERAILKNMQEADFPRLSLDIFIPKPGSLVFLFVMNSITIGHIIPDFAGHRPRMVWEKATPR